MKKIFKTLILVVIFQNNTVSAPPLFDSLDVAINNKEISYRVKQADTLKFTYRELDRNRLERFHSDADFNYRMRTQKGPTLWDRILLWLGEFINRLLYASGSTSAGKFIIYSLIIGALIFSVLKLLNVSPSKLIVKPASKNLPFKVAHENIHEIPFESRIEEALENKNYKLAIRLYYLFSLKKLTDSGLIEWAPGKSNHDYIYELKRRVVKENFSSLSRLFEYAWYGGFQIEKSLSDQSRKYVKLILSDLKS